MPLQRELFGGRVQQGILAASAKAIAAREGKHSARATLMNLLRIANYKKRKTLTIDELLAAERAKTTLSMIILENILKALETKKESNHKELSLIKFSLGKIKPMKGEIAEWERKVHAMGKNYNISMGRFQMYRLLKLDPMDIFRAEVYLRTKNTKTTSRSPIPQQENIIKLAIQSALRFV